MNSYLVVYDLADGTLLQLDEFADPNEAAEARLKREIELSERDGLEIVVLAAESQDALRRTHARYFNTVGELARTASSRSAKPSSDGAWEVRVPGADRASARGTKAEMIHRGRAILRAAGGGELRVKGARPVEIKSVIRSDAKDGKIAPAEIKSVIRSDAKDGKITPVAPGKKTRRRT